MRNILGRQKEVGIMTKRKKDKAIMINNKKENNRQ
jgi:hypothetical protein